jgi:anti-sigma factor RsiW
MECNQAQLSAYLDDELDASSAANYAQHLLSCAACNRAYEELTQLRATLNDNLPRYSAPSHLRHRILSDLEALKPRTKKRQASRWFWINVGLSSVCSIAFAASMTLYLAMPTQAELINQEIVASHYRSLLASHLADVASSDHHTVKPWFTGKLDYAPVVIDFVGDGFPLLGGRLDYINKRTVAALAYRHNKHLINVFIWPESSGKSSSITSIQGFNVLQWNDAGMSYHAVSDMNAQELENLRQLITAHKE